MGITRGTPASYINRLCDWLIVTVESLNKRRLREASSPNVRHFEYFQAYSPECKAFCKVSVLLHGRRVHII